MLAREFIDGNKGPMWVLESYREEPGVTLGKLRPSSRAAFLFCRFEGACDFRQLSSKATPSRGLRGGTGPGRVPHLLEIRSEGDKSAVGFAQLEADAIGVAVRLQALLSHLAVGQPHTDPQLRRHAPRVHAARRPSPKQQRRQQ